MATPGGYLQASSSSASSMSSSSFASGDSSSSPTITKPTSLTIRELEDITDNFSEERVLGQGAYGKVYKGIFENGVEIAVKMLHNNIQAIDDDKFQEEFTNLMKLDHTNTIRLVAYCYETRYQHMDFKGRVVFGEKTYKALCFEYMQMGSLRRHLFDETLGHDWQTRYKIIKGTCAGLKYLHEGFEKPIYHLDIKPDNILLDKDMVPKLADFGLSKLFGEEQTRVTKCPIGTIGYMPPEYLFGHVVSKKLDIYSLGVLITKIIAGPRGHSRSAETHFQEFLDQVNKNWRSRLEAECTLHTLEGNCEQVSICTEIALRCMDQDRHKRPNIVDIIDILDVTEAMIEKGTALRSLLSSTTLDDNRRAKLPASKFSGPAKLFCRQEVDNALRSVDSSEDCKLLKAEESPRGFRDISDMFLENMTIDDHETEKYDPKVRDKEAQYMVQNRRKEMRERKEVAQAQLRSRETMEELLKKPAMADAEMTRQIEEEVKGELEYTRPMPATEQKYTYRLKEEHVSKTRKSGIVQYMMEGEWS